MGVCVWCPHEISHMRRPWKRRVHLRTSDTRPKSLVYPLFFVASHQLFNFHLSRIPQVLVLYRIHEILKTPGKDPNFLLFENFVIYKLNILYNNSKLIFILNLRGLIYSPYYSNCMQIFLIKKYDVKSMKSAVFLRIHF